MNQKEEYNKLISNLIEDLTKVLNNYQRLNVYTYGECESRIQTINDLIVDLKIYNTK